MKNEFIKTEDLFRKSHLVSTVKFEDLTDAGLIASRDAVVDREELITLTDFVETDWVMDEGGHYFINPEEGVMLDRKFERIDPTGMEECIIVKYTVDGRTYANIFDCVGGGLYFNDFLDDIKWTGIGGFVFIFIDGYAQLVDLGRLDRFYLEDWRKDLSCEKEGEYIYYFFYTDENGNRVKDSTFFDLSMVDPFE